MTSADPSLPELGLRISRLRAAMFDLGLEAMVVTKLVNIRWLTGFSGSSATLAVTDSNMLITTDARYQDQVVLQTEQLGDDLDIHIGIDSFGAVAEFLGSVSVGFESRYMSVHDHVLLGAKLDGLMPTADLIESLRQEKDQFEVAALAKACAIADRAFAATFALIHQQPTEREFAAALEFSMAGLGSEGTSFDSIVASGPNSALPHAMPGDRTIEHGDLVLLDFGAKVEGYGSDMTRTVVAGGEPTPRQSSFYETVVRAQTAAVGTVGPGVAERAVDSACRSIISEAGMGDAFTHGTGHGIGLEIHEQPILSARSEGILRPGLVITVEPGAYLPGFGGVRVEDSVVVGSDVCTTLTRSPKGLVPNFENEA